jgi:hypothetical protein
MTREQRDAAKQRLEVLELRLDGISALTVNGDAGEMGFTLQPIINETVAEIASLERTLATSLEFLFNFKGGGWNSEVAYTKEDAIEQAIFKYGHPDTQTHLRVDTSTFRVSTPEDYKNQLSSFY